MSAQLMSPFTHQEVKIRDGCLHIAAVFRCGNRHIVTDEDFSEELWIQAQRDPAIALFIIQSIEKTRQTFLQQHATEITNP